MMKFAKIPLYYIIVALFFISGISLIIIGLLKTQENPQTPETKGTITFAIYGDAEQRRIINETVKYFEKDNNCEAEIYCFSTMEALQKRIMSQYSVGAPFDVFYIDDYNMNQLMNKLVPLDDILIESSNAGDVFIEKALSAGKIGKTQYALPTGVRPYCIFYNKKKLTQNQIALPQEYMDSKKWDLKNFSSYCTAIFNKTGNPAYAISPEWQSLYGFIIGNGGKITGFNGGLTVLDEKGVEAMNTIKKLIDSGAVTFLDKLQWGADSLSLFRSESVSMVAGSIEYIYELHDSVDFEWDIIPMPMISSDFSSTVIDIPKIAVSKGENEIISKQFVKFFLSSFGQKIRLEEGERLFSSLNMAFYTSFGGVSFPNHSNFLFFMAENGQTQPTNAYYIDNEKMIIGKYKKFINKELSIQDFIQIGPVTGGGT